MTKRGKAEHLKGVRRAVDDFLSKHRRRAPGHGDIDDQLGPLERCADCGLPLVEGAAGFDLHPEDEAPRRRWCRRCAYMRDDQRSAPEEP